MPDTVASALHRCARWEGREYYRVFGLPHPIPPFCFQYHRFVLSPPFSFSFSFSFCLFVFFSCSFDQSFFSSELTKLMAKLTPEQRVEPAISHALGMREAMALSDYHNFFRLYKTAPNMGPYILDLFLDRMRLMALKVMTRAYRPTVAVDFVQNELAFSSRKECVRFLTEHGGALQSKTEIDSKKTLAALSKGNPTD